VNDKTAKTISIAVITGAIAALMSLLAIWVVSFAAAGGRPIQDLLAQMAVALDRLRLHLPENIAELLPADIEALKALGAEWLRGNGRQVAVIGQDVGRIAVHIIIGIVIGALVAFAHEVREQVRLAANSSRPLFAQAGLERARNLTLAFRQVVFSQVRISALNTVLTGLFLGIAMPLLGWPLPLTKTLVVVTFVVGLLPVIGNLISNTAIFLVALSVSPYAAVGALLFLVVIHKLEYFLNAGIIGSRIHARAWELLVAMITMEAAFGVPGLIAAPIFYAFLKIELRGAGLI
jgi:predicted PurR-regulated permease PerM